MTNAAVVKAESALLVDGGASEAESILLQAGFPFKAVVLNLQLYQFDRYS